MKHIILVFIGGGFGSIARYLIGKFLNTLSFPWGTLIVNILGSFIIGVVMGLALKNHSINQNYTLLIATGFCGGFTTFSSFAYENFMLLKQGELLSFFMYAFGSILLALFFVFVGVYITKYFAA